MRTGLGQLIRKYLTFVDEYTGQFTGVGANAAGSVKVHIVAVKVSIA
jgi:hypothetical protein